MCRIVLLAVLFLFSLHSAYGAEPVRIGVSLALTGEFSVMGNMQMKGYRLWEKNVNSRGGMLGRPVQVIIHDDKGDTETARALYEQMINRDKVDLVFAPYSTKLTGAILPVTEKYRYPALIAGAAGDSLWEKGYAYAIGVYTPSSKFTAGFFELLVRAKIDNIALVSADDAFSWDLAESAKIWAKRFGLKVAFFETFMKGTRELDALALRARDSGADVIMVCGHFDEAVNMRMALKRISWSPRAYYASIGPALQEFHDRVKDESEYVFSTSLWEPRANFPGAQRFYDEYISAYQETPGYHAALAYGAGEVIEAAVRSAGRIDRERVRTALFKLDTMTIIGRYGIDSSGKQIRQHNFIVQWQKGRKQIVWPEKLKTVEPAFR